MSSIFVILSGLFWAVWRRCFGEGKFKKILSRTVQEIIGVLVLIFTLITVISWKGLGIAALVSVWFMIFYWIQAVGCILDGGLNPVQNRHNYDKWYRPLCNQIVDFLNWLFDLLHINYHIHKYYGVYDWIFSSVRNFIACLPGMIFYWSWLWFILVLCMYPIYLACYKLFQKYPSLFTNKIFVKLTINEPKNLAEVIHGFVVGLILPLV